MPNKPNALDVLRQSWDHMNEWELRDECWRLTDIIESLQLDITKRVLEIDWLVEEE